jgi:hypothetical protein
VPQDVFNTIAAFNTPMHPYHFSNVRATALSMAAAGDLKLLLVILERKKERSTPVARRVLRGHELGSGHRTYLCLVIQGSLIL